MPKKFIDLYYVYYDMNNNQKDQIRCLKFDPLNDFYMDLVTSLYEFRQKWIEKNGALPEELDCRCIDMMGMRFSLFLSTLVEIRLRFLLLDSGSISDLFQYLSAMEVEGEIHHISKEEHDAVCCLMKILFEHKFKLTEFLNSLADFAI